MFYFKMQNLKQKQNNYRYKLKESFGHKKSVVLILNVSGTWHDHHE